MNQKKESPATPEAPVWITVIAIISGVVAVLIVGIMWESSRYPIMFATIIGAAILKIRERRAEIVKPRTPSVPASLPLPRRPLPRRY